MLSDTLLVREFIDCAIEFTTKSRGAQDGIDGRKDLYIVVIRYDGRAVMFTASAELVLREAVNLVPDSGVYYRWKLFDDIKEADVLLERLRNIDKTTPIPESPAVKHAQR